MKSAYLTLIAAALASAAQAEQIWTAGLTCDAYGNVYGWTDTNKDNKYDESESGDGLYCWASTATNVITWWQEQNPIAAALAEKAPQGQQEVWNNLRNTFRNDSGSAGEAIDWFFTGYQPQQPGFRPGADKTGAYYSGVGYTNYDCTLVDPRSFKGTGWTEQDNDLVWSADLEDQSVDQALLFSNTLRGYLEKGYAISLGVAGGYIPYKHALMLWGAEFDDKTGLLTTMYVTDSDDASARVGEMGLFALKCQEELVEYGIGEYIVGRQTVFAIDTDVNNEAMLEENPELGSHPWNWYTWSNLDHVYDFTAFKADFNLNAKKHTISAGETVLENTELEGPVALAGAGVTIGNGTGLTILMGADGLTLDGMEDEGCSTGLVVTKNAMLDLGSFSASNFYDGGFRNEGTAFLRNGALQVCNNFSVNEGAGLSNYGHLEIRNMDEVVVAANTAIGTANGGGIYNESSLSIRENSEVVFAYNSSVMGEGQDIFNAKGGTASVANNSSVFFMGENQSDAIANRGDLYLAAGKEQYMYFMDCGIDSLEGTVYVGAEATGRTVRNDGAISFVDGILGLQQMDLAMHAKGKPAEFSNVKIGINGIHGAGMLQSFVKGAAITAEHAISLADVTLQNVTVQGTDSLTLSRAGIVAAGSSFTVQDGGIVLDRIVIDLTGWTAATGSTYDLTSLFTADAVTGTFSVAGLGTELEGYTFVCGNGTMRATLLGAAEGLDVSAEEDEAGKPAAKRLAGKTSASGDRSLTAAKPDGAQEEEQLSGAVLALEVQAPAAPAIQVVDLLKSIAETRAAAAATVNRTADFMLSTAVNQAKAAASGKHGVAAFSAAGGSNLRYNTGSSVQGNGFNVAVGVAKAFDGLTLGVAGEYATTDFRSHAGGISAQGENALYGGALLLDWQGKGGWHMEGAVRMGRVSSEYNGLLNTKDDAAYQGVTIGAGKSVTLSDSTAMDLYARYMFSYTAGSMAKGEGAGLRYESVSSHRSVLGARVNHQLSDKVTVYAGAAWMHEYAGDAAVSIDGMKSPSPSLEGSSGMLEVGTILAPFGSERVLLNLNLSGWTGVQRGISGGAGISVSF